jgi:hypothetical protein
MRAPYGFILVVSVAISNVLWVTSRRRLVPTIAGSFGIGVVWTFLALQLSKVFQQSGIEAVSASLKNFGALKTITVDITVTMILLGWLLSVVVALFVWSLQRLKHFQVPPSA